MVQESQLQRIPVFAGLEQAELASLRTVMSERKVQKSSFILYADDPGPSLMFIVQGRAKVNISSNDGKEIVLATLGDGDFFGEISVLTGEERSANVVAVTDCEILILNKDEFDRHIQNYRGLAINMLRELAHRLRGASEKIGDLALFDVYRRIARTLKSMAVSSDAGNEKLLIIDPRPTHQELAAMTGTSREMVTRALKGLEEDGCIVITGKRIEVYKMPL